MTPTMYQILAMRTAKDMGSQQMNLIHGAMGVSSDAGELVDAIKKHTIYGKELDWDNVVEELGDVLWFCALIAETVGTNLSVVMEKNIEKLSKRYPAKYSDEAAIARADKQPGVFSPDDGRLQLEPCTIFKDDDDNLGTSKYIP